MARWSDSELIGRRFARLLVVGLAGRRGQKRLWRCRCDCGNYAAVLTADLASGHTRSCGCRRTEVGATAPLTHGASRGGRLTPVYRSWLSMRRRCLDPSNKSFPRYGGRGISVCERWLDFSNFLADMGERPEAASLERLNNNGNYEPGNCVWADTTTQARNRRNAILIEIRGAPMPLPAACELFSVPYRGVRDLMRGRGPANHRDALVKLISRTRGIDCRDAEALLRSGAC